MKFVIFTGCGCRALNMDANGLSITGRAVCTAAGGAAPAPASAAAGAAAPAGPRALTAGSIPDAGSERSTTGPERSTAGSERSMPGPERPTAGCERPGRGGRGGRAARLTSTSPVSAAADCSMSERSAASRTPITCGRGVDERPSRRSSFRHSLDFSAEERLVECVSVSVGMMHGLMYWDVPLSACESVHCALVWLGQSCTWLMQGMVRGAAQCAGGCVACCLGVEVPA